MLHRKRTIKKCLFVAAMFAASSSFANFYSERPCSLVQLMLTQPALQQAMRIYIDHLEMNGQTVHAECTSSQCPTLRFVQ